VSSSPRIRISTEFEGCTRAVHVHVHYRTAALYLRTVRLLHISGMQMSAESTAAATAAAGAYLLHTITQPRRHRRLAVLKCDVGQNLR
jgi:hypothetical protein